MESTSHTLDGTPNHPPTHRCLPVECDPQVESRVGGFTFDLTRPMSFHVAVDSCPFRIPSRLPLVAHPCHTSATSASYLSPTSACSLLPCNEPSHPYLSVAYVIAM